jgi:hypothetical protein
VLTSAVARIAATSALFARMLAASEAEKRGAGRALHSDVSPGISAAILELNLLLREPPAALAQVVPASVERTLRALAESASALRTIELTLRPPLLDELGLGAPLRWMADRSRVALQLPETLPRLAPELEWQLFQSITTLVRQGLRGRRTVAIEGGKTLVLRIGGTPARGWPLAVADARIRLAGAARLSIRGHQVVIRILPSRSRRTPRRTFR